MDAFSDAMKRYLGEEHSLATTRAKLELRRILNCSPQDHYLYDPCPRKKLEGKREREATCLTCRVLSFKESGYLWTLKHHRDSDQQLTKRIEALFEAAIGKRASEDYSVESPLLMDILDNLHLLYGCKMPRSPG